MYRAFDMKRIFSGIAKQPWPTYLRILVGKEKENSQRATLIRGSGGTFALKVGAVVLGFAISLSLTRILGSHGYGIYAYAMAWVNVLAIIATLGMHGVLVRQIAIYKGQEKWSLLQGIITYSTKITATSSTILLCAGALVTWWLWRKDGNAELQEAFWVALLIVPFLTLVKMRQSAMMGLQHALSGQMPDMLIRPVLFLTFIWLAYAGLGGKLTPTTILALQIVAAIAALIFASRWLAQTLTNTLPQAGTNYDAKTWLTSAMPLLFVQCMQVINSKADVVMLGTMDSMQSVGIYAVAVQISSLITFVLISVNAALAPVVARLYSSGQIGQLQAIITKSARVILLLALPASLILIFFGEWVLRIFGSEFVAGKTALTILAIGQLINAAMGSVGLLLVMTGHETRVAMGVAIAATLNITMNALLIPQLGINGAAISSAISMGIWNILLMTWLRTDAKLDPTALGIITRNTDHQC